MTDLFLEFPDVFVEDMGSVNKGRVKIADQAVVFKNEKTGKLTTVSAGEMHLVEWTRLANRPAIRIKFGKEESTFRVGGFSEKDFARISAYIEKNWNLKVGTTELAIKGWNYGDAKVEGATLEFSVDGKMCFEVPLQNVSKCSTGKNEATLEFHQNDDASVGLMEMRFHMADNEESEKVEEFREAIMKFAGIEAETGQAVASLSQILCTTPRGRYDIKVYPNHLSLHGKTYDYKIPTKTITRLFLVPHKDGRHMYFVISVNPPIRQGQTRYHYLVLEFSKDDHVDLVLGMTEEQLQELYQGKLERELSGSLYEVVSKIFRVLINMRITVPGNFVGHSGTPAVMCAHKQTSGFLYPLEKGFLYIHKPPMYVRFEEVSSVHFARSDVSTRSFDFEIELKAGQTLVFNSVEKEEYNKLYDFVQNKRLRIRNAKKMEKSYAEDRFAGSDDEIDPYKEAVKAEGKEKVAGEDDSSDTDDDDYDLDEDLAKRKKLREENSSEGSQSEPDEEFDSDAGSSDEEDEDGEGGEGEDEDGERPKKKKKTEKERKEKGESSGKKKKRKDPDAPKKSLTAYLIWLNENRSSIKKEGDKVSDVAKRGGELWKAMSADDKKKWEKLAEKDKERYEEEMKVYKSSGKADEFKKKAKAAKAAKATTASTKNRSPQKNAKSKEFIDSDDGSSEDEDKPLKAKKEEKKEKKEKEVEKKEVKKEASESEASDDSNDSD